MSMRLRVRWSLRALSSALAMCCALLSACESAPTPRFVEPLYREPCRHVTCSGAGECVTGDAQALATTQTPTCLCDVGYRFDDCSRCEIGFHRDALNRCVTDVRCADQVDDPCAPGGECIDVDSVISCSCDEGYAGPRCNVCADRYARDDYDRCLPIAWVPPLTDGGEPPVQACDTGYEGPGCMLCATGFHRSGADCVRDQVCAATTCPEHAACMLVDGQAMCVCDDGYDGARCIACAPGFHERDDECVVDEVCGEDSCSEHATCAVVEGEITCTCRQGWQGAQCELCRPGQMQTMDFAPHAGWPMEQDTCYARAELFTTHAILRSQRGDTVVRLCAPSLTNGFTTRHVELAASPTRAAEVELLEPAVAISFDYATRLQPLSLNVSADGVIVDDITLPAQSQGSMTLELDPPASVIGFISRNQYAQVISLDNIVSHYGQCE